MPTDFRTPWSRLLIVLSIFVTLVLIAVGLAAVRLGGIPGLFAKIVPSVILGVTALFTVRGLTLTDDALVVRRLGWVTELPLAGIRSVEAIPRAMSRSIRLFGIGGLFSFSGIYWSKRLGRYRAYVTDQNRTVVIRWRSATAVVSTADPDALIAALQRRIPAQPALPTP